MDPAQRAKAIQDHAMVCVGASKAVSELREARARGERNRDSTRALILQLWQEIDEHQQQMWVLMREEREAREAREERGADG
jgi:hypothetical protein